eukprot:m.27759 g.27759  ORF g.27759 m.27759 type:complete len:58 (+) comp30314_c0_seq1:98-271(+)
MGMTEIQLKARVYKLNRTNPITNNTDSTQWQPIDGQSDQVTMPVSRALPILPPSLLT